VHVYTSAGTFSVSLVASGPGGSDTETKEGYVSVYAPPLAGFSGVPTSGIAPLNVSFADESSGVIETWAWDFGDGTTSGTAAPTHTYVTPGLYQVTLAVSGPGGADSEVKPGYVNVEHAPPIALFSGAPTSGVAPLAVAFSDLSSGAITSHAWDFGDGSSSTLASPAHTFAAPGTYTVSLVVSGPGGSSTETKTDYIDALHPAPVAEFSAAPRLGPLPLSVAFTDASTGTVTAWDWDFGDGGASTSAAPTHVFQESGLYAVTLAVSGPGGQDVETKVDYVCVLETPSVGIADPSFESLAAGVAPASPWKPFFGGLHRVKPDLATSDNGMPSDGAQWLEIDASGTAAAQPPSNPGGAGDLPAGGAGVVQSFSLGSSGAKLRFDAAFLRDGAANDAAFDDWMSVDLCAGATTVNLYYADTFTPTPNVSVDHGLPMTAITPVEADLVELFPEATLETVFNLFVQVGNGGDGVRSSKGYVDDFRLEHEPGTQTTYGCGVNPSGTLVVLAGEPTIGTTLTLGVENPLGTQARGARTFLMVSAAPDPLYPCGSLRQGWGMTAPGAAGEFLLWSPSGAAMGSAHVPLAGELQLVVGPAWAGVGFPAPIDLAIADELGLAGTTIYAQGLLLDPLGTFGVVRALTEAREIVLGH
jgi:PKD repeat protein